MITAQEARENNLKYIEVAIDSQLKDILSDIKRESESGTAVDWIVYSDIRERNRVILKDQGYEVSQYTSGASAYRWKIKW